MKLSPALPLLLVLAAAAGADEKTPRKPPLTKPDEAKKFHPRRAGMPPGPRMAGYERRLQMEKESLFQGLRFRSVGPEVQGGRIVDIDSPSAHPDALLVAFASGGLWRTDNRGGSWTPLFDRESTFTIGDFAIGDKDGQVLYVGTGENNSSRSSYAGTGLFKSTDGGKTWRHLGLADSHHIGRVLVDPRDPQRVYVAALGHLYTDNDERGVYVSEDGGATWTRTLYVDDRTGAVDLAQDPSDPSILYAAMWEKARTAWNFLESGPGSGLYKSADRGRTWSRLSGLPAGADLGRIGVEVAASRPQTVYVVLDNQAWRPESEPLDEDTPPGELTPKRLLGLTAEAFARLGDAVVARYLRRYDYPRSLKAAALKRHVRAGRITIADLVDYVSDANRDLFERAIVGSEVYRSDDAGRTWRKTHEGRIEKVYYSYGYYFGRVHVDPSNAERLYFGGVPFLGSEDGGKTWTGLDQRGVHVDHHALYIDPRAPNRVALGNDGGLNLSFDHGRTWTKVNNVPVGQFTTITVDNAEPYNIMGGLQDNGVLRGPSTYVPGKSDPNAWRQVYGGDGSAVIADPKDPNLVYAAYQFGFASRLNLKTGERARVRPRPELTPEKKEKPLRYNWVTPIILSPHSNNVVYYGANRLYRSFDRGDTWTAISDDLTTNPAEQGDVPFGTLTTISESPRRFGLLYAGTDDGKVWLTRDGGLNWIEVTAGLAPGKWVTRVVASAFDEGMVYVTQNGYRDDEFTPYVWKSTDYGKTWQSIAAGLPAEPVNVLREDPKTKTLLYVGTDMGVFTSLDGGASWKAMASGLPHVPVHDLAVHPRDGDLVLGTHGRSVYVAGAAPLRALTPEVMAKPLHAFAPKTVTADPNRAYGDHPWITWPRLDVLVRLPYWSAKPGPVTISVKDAGGSVWKELSATALAGLNEIEYDLSADGRLAEAAEARAREKARAEQARADAQKKKEPTKEPEKAETAVEDEEGGEPADTPASASGRPALDAELERVLADPLRSTRRRYLAPGRYTLEMKAAGATSTSTLTVKAPKEDAAGDDEATEDGDADPDR